MLRVLNSLYRWQVRAHRCVMTDEHRAFLIGGSCLSAWSGGGPRASASGVAEPSLKTCCDDARDGPLVAESVSQPVWGLAVLFVVGSRMNCAEFLTYRSCHAFVVCDVVTKILRTVNEHKPEVLIVAAARPVPLSLGKTPWRWE